MEQHFSWWFLLSTLLLLLFSGGVLADEQTNVYSRDSAYYNGQQLSPVETNFPLYYRDSIDLLQDLSKFEKLYIQYHSCKWTDLLVSSNDGNNDANDVDENDYWYQGVNPAPTAAAAISVYGVLPDTRTSKWKLRRSQGCQRQTFLNTYVVDPHYLFLKDDNDGDQQYSSCGNNEGNDQPYGLGCTETGEFSYYEYSLNWQNEPVCDANHVLSVVDSLDDWNSALDEEDNGCLEVSYATAKSLLSYTVSCSFEDPDCPDPVGVLKRYRNALRSPYNKTIKITRGVAWGIAAFFGAYVVLVLLDELRIACNQSKGNDNDPRFNDGRKDDETVSSLSEDGSSSVAVHGAEDQPRGLLTYMSRLLRRKQSSSQNVDEKVWSAKTSLGPSDPIRKAYVPGEEGKLTHGVDQLINVESRGGSKANDGAPRQLNGAMLSSTKLVHPNTIGPRATGRNALQGHQDNPASVSPQCLDTCMFQSESKTLDMNRFSHHRESPTSKACDWFLSVFGTKPTIDPTVPPAQPITFRSLEQTRAKKKIVELPRIDEDGESGVSQEQDSCKSESLIQPPPYNETSMEVLFGKSQKQRKWRLLPRRLSKRVDVVRSDASTCRTKSNISAKIIGFTASPHSSTSETSLALAEAARLASQRSASTNSVASLRSSLLPTNDSVRCRSFESVDNEYLPPDQFSTSESSEGDQTDASGMHPSDEEQSVELSAAEAPTSLILCCRGDFNFELQQVNNCRPRSSQEAVLDSPRRDSCDNGTFVKSKEMIAISEITEVGVASSPSDVDKNRSPELRCDQETTAKSQSMASSDGVNFGEEPNGKDDTDNPSCQKSIIAAKSLGTSEPLDKRPRSCQEAFEMVASPAMIRRFHGKHKIAAEDAMGWKGYSD